MERGSVFGWVRAGIGDEGLYCHYTKMVRILRLIKLLARKIKLFTYMNY